MDHKQKCMEQRNFLKANFIGLENVITDQMNSIDYPPVQKDYDGEPIKLPEIDTERIPNKNIIDCIKNRRSRRKFSDENISLHDLSFLLWATQGVQRKLNDDKITLRPVPSGGARHPFETYLAINCVDGLEKGIYRYLPLEHALIFLFSVDDMKNKLTEANLGQPFAGESAVTFLWSVIPYRTEWRYSFVSAKTILLDCGHLGQNLYLACEAIGLGTCAIAAYDQKKCDDLLKLDREDEFVVYVSPVGKY
ncbi:MAG: SagB/ThcOx family dehydrogenase [Candidatus Cloacimonetes bacterium]|nr:SagB/ThcOx family dehydrogenase [Candidatus Cloacimonadota bacterium]